MRQELAAVESALETLVPVDVVDLAPGRQRYAQFTSDSGGILDDLMVTRSSDPAEDGVRCYAPDGDLIGKVHLPEGCANLCFGGKKKDRLFMTASTSVYALYINGKGAMMP